jgi:hypothetical protein
MLGTMVFPTLFIVATFALLGFQTHQIAQTHSLQVVNMMQSRSRAHLGRVLGPLGLILGSVGPSWAISGLSWGILAQLGGILG